MTQKANHLIAEILAPTIKEAVKEAVGKKAAAAPITTEVMDTLTRETAAVVLNQTNNEPWYQSRVTWGAIIAVIAGLAGIAGYTFGPDDQAAIVNAIVGITSAVGGLLSWYGRWKATKPIGA